MGFHRARRFSWWHFVLIFFIYCSVNAELAYGEPSFDFASVYSENRAYNSQFFTFPAGSVYENGNAAWFMYANAKVTGTPNNPVLLTPTPSTPSITDYELTFAGNGLSKAVFFTFDHATYGGPFDPPGNAWENKTYTFKLRI